MSKKSNIRWRESDTAQLKRAVKNFNAKISYQLKKHPERAEYLPQKLKYKDVKANISTRSELNRQLHSLQRFQKRGAEKPVHGLRGVKTTEWEWKEYKTKERIDNARKTRELKKVQDEEVKIGGKGTGNKRAEMGTVKENSLKPSHKSIDNMSQKEWELARKNIDNRLNENYRNSKLEQMRENYIKGLTENGFLDFDDSIEFYIRNVDLDTFFTITQTDETGSFYFYKDPIAWETRREQIFKTWKTAFEKGKK